MVSTCFNRPSTSPACDCQLAKHPRHGVTRPTPRCAVDSVDSVKPRKQLGYLMGYLIGYIHGLYMGYTGLYINWYTCNRIINISTHTWSSWKQLVEILFVVALFECQLVQFIVSWMHHSWFFQCLCHNGDWSIFAPYVHVVEGLRHAAERWVPSLIFGDGPRICW